MQNTPIVTITGINEPIGGNRIPSHYKWMGRVAITYTEDNTLKATSFLIEVRCKNHTRMVDIVRNSVLEHMAWPSETEFILDEFFYSGQCPPNFGTHRVKCG